MTVHRISYVLPRRLAADDLAGMLEEATHALDECERVLHEREPHRYGAGVDLIEPVDGVLCVVRGLPILQRDCAADAPCVAVQAGGSDVCASPRSGGAAGPYCVPSHQRDLAGLPVFVDGRAG